MKNPRLYVECAKHGHHWALPVIEGALRPHTEWPADVESLPRICAKCVAESMAQPVRRSGIAA